MRVVALAALAVLAGVPSAAAAVPEIHAHRGGPVLAGVPTFPEESMPAFRNAAREGYWLELDAKLTADGVPVVIHDATLDRTTTCTGQVRAKTLAELGECRLDVLGSPGGGLPSKQVEPTERIATLAEVLAFALEEGAHVNLEIKNQPNDSDFDDSGAFAEAVMDTVVQSGFPKERLIIQSFWPNNLTVAQRRLPGVAIALLTLSALNDGGPAFASAMDYRWVSPEWPVSPGYVEDAHGMGLLVVPYTLNLEQEVRDARAAGVDAVITDDPLMAQLTLGFGRRDLLPETLRPTAALDAPMYASERSRGLRFPLRLGGADRGSGLESFRLEWRRNVDVSERWRLVGETESPQASFRGRPGASYVFRLRVRDRLGNRSTYDYGETVVPFDDRSSVLRFQRGWRRTRARSAWRGTLTRARAAGAAATARFEGQRVALIARRTRRGGRLRVSLDGRRKAIVSLRGSGHRRLVFRSPVLRPGTHLLELRALGGGVEIDAIAIDRGPPAPA